MVWKSKDKEFIMKTRVAIFPKRIGDYWIWLQKYYVNYDWINDGRGGCYVSHYYISKNDCEYCIRQKIESDRIEDEDCHEF